MNNMDEDKKTRLCPGCGREMDTGYLQISEYAAFNRQRQIWSLRPDEEGEVQLTGDGLFSDHRGNFHGWICRDCGLILFDYTDNRAGMGRPVLDTISERMDAFFEAADRFFDGRKTEKTEPEPSDEPSCPAETPKKRIITSSGVQMADDKETR